jgi:hypothetical protein
MPYVSEPEESEEQIARRSDLTRNPALSSVTPDEGYLKKGWRRVLTGEGKDVRWCYTDAPEEEETPRLVENPPGHDVQVEPPDLYKSKETFPDGMV